MFGMHGLMKVFGAGRYVRVCRCGQIMPRDARQCAACGDTRLMLAPERDARRIVRAAAGAVAAAREVTA
ncbi:MAG: hypothetical protein AB7D57_06710 [Desulfovibrionaceae bacterium]